MALTKKQLIDALTNLDVSDETLVVLENGIGFEDIYDVEIQNLVETKTMEEMVEIPAIVLK
ncbi:hypothetical protein b3_0163 [Synechococcus phage B3]|nr:hypothetical protein b3_0163 [Synechococcus phage B3]QGT54777.1 hypothetical protein b23_0162 [Synechococcus phage B23]